MTKDCIIIGAGLSGLYTAYLLEQAGLDYQLLEARGRIGGRIDCTTWPLPAGGVARYDLGPAWIWPQLQPLMAELTQVLDVPLMPQRVQGAGLYEDMGTGGPVRLDTPSPHRESFRIAQGALSLVEALAARLSADRLTLGACVNRLVEAGDHVIVESEDGETWQAARVVMALPPRLVSHRLQFDPPLAPALHDRFRATPTWMAGHAKCVAFYEEAFWETQGLSGEVFSRIGPLTEIYDASPAGEGPRALFGFFGLPAHARRQIGQAGLVEHVLAQLVRLFGPPARDALELRIKDWSDAAFTATPDDAQPPGGHPMYGLPANVRTIWDGKLYFSGTETAGESGGYLEGALEAGRDAAQHIATSLKPG